MNILVCNAGSTSLKFKLYRFPEKQTLFVCKIERIGEARSVFTCEVPAGGYARSDSEHGVPSYREGIERFLAALKESGAVSSERDIAAVGFKTVIAKGYYGVHLLDDAVLAGMEEYLDIAPSHNRPYLDAVALFRARLPSAPLVGVFETAFHTTIPRERTLYALPYAWAEKYGVRKYGYHGASHGYVARCVEARYGRGKRTVSLHLGGSASACAISDGKSVDTSFGFSLQTGLPHATRCGDVDSYLIPLLVKRGIPYGEVCETLTKGAGLKGLSGTSGDMRDIERAAAAGDARAKLALDVYICAIVRYVGAFFAELGGLDVLSFTGGIGEHSVLVRGAVCAKLGALGVRISEEKNGAPAAFGGDIAEDGAPVRVLVVPADEESVVAEETYETVLGLPLRK